MAKALGSREGDDHTAKQMLRILGELGGVAAQELLWRQALIRKGAARLVALQSLSASGFLAEGRNHDAAELLRLETAGAAKLFAARRTLGKEERWIILRRALSDEIDLRRVSILACLSLMADRATVVQAADALQTGGAETSAYALEALESVLDRQTRDLTFPVLEEISEDERTQRLAQHAGPEPADEDEVLDTLLSGELSADVDVWTRWCAFYLAQASGRPGVGQLMELWSGDADPWLRQAAAWNGELEHGAEEACAAPPFAAAMGTLQQAEVFGASPDQVLVRLARGSEHRVLQTGEVLFSEGDPGDALYIVEEGQIHAQRGGERVGSFGPGEIFGEFTVLIDGARTATIKAAEPSTILSIPRARLLEVIAARSVLGVRLLGALVRRLLDAEHPPPPAAPAAQKADIFSSHASPADLHRALLLRRSALFGAMDPQALAGISPLFEQRFYPAGSPVITEGETGDRLYVVASGRLSVSCDSTTLRELGDGAVFGERALLLDEPRSASVSAVEDTELLELPNNLFRRMLLEKPQTIQGLVWDVLARYR